MVQRRHLPPFLAGYQAGLWNVTLYPVWRLDLFLRSHSRFGGSRGIETLESHSRFRGLRGIETLESHSRFRGFGGILGIWSFAGFGIVRDSEGSRGLSVNEVQNFISKLYNRLCNVLFYLTLYSRIFTTEKLTFCILLLTRWGRLCSVSEYDKSILRAILLRYRYREWKNDISTKHYKKNLLWA